MPSTGSHARQLPPSSLPTRLVRRCLPTSATRALQAGVGPCPFRRRPLSGCRLSRKTFPAALSVHWPWSPSLPAPYSSARLGPSFDGFPVPRDHPTSLVPSPSRPFVLDGYHPLGGGREISLGKQRKTSCPCRRHYSRLPDGYWVRRRLPASPQDVRLPAFRSRSAWHFTIDFHQTPPRGPHPSDPTTAPLSHRCEVPSARALRGLSSSLHLLFCAHARRTKSLATRILPVRTVRVPGISSPQGRSARKNPWRQEFFLSEPSECQEFRHREAAATEPSGCQEFRHRMPQR